MTDQQKLLVQQTFRDISLESESTAALFYKRLFELAPEVRPLFKGDLREQGIKLMQTLSFVVSSLNHLDSISANIKSLGERHHKYGVQPQYYGFVGEAMLWAFEQTLGQKFTPQVKESWEEVYTNLAVAMLSA